MSEPYDLDETACDACGVPTPKLEPPAERELCDRCYRAGERASEIAGMNEQTYLAAIQRWFREVDARSEPSRTQD